MKTLLMNIPDVHVAKTTSDWDLSADDIGVFPPIGIMYVAAAVQAHGGHEVKLLDTMIDRLSPQQIVQKVKEYDPDVVGITVYTPTLYDALLVCHAIKEATPDKIIVWGGPHTSEFPDECLDNEDLVDYIVMGEAEETFPSLLDSLEKGESPEGINGISFKKNGEVIRPPDRGYIKDIDSLPVPAFELLDFKKYYSAVSTGGPIAAVCSSRGCPFLCTYCLSPYKKYRSRSVEGIIAEMKVYYDKGIRDFFFFDDLFNITAKRLKAIGEGIKETGWDISWSFRGRVDAIDNDSLAVAKKSGLTQIFFGVEAGTDEGLKAIKKKLTLQQVKKTVNLCKAHRIKTSTNWIIGFPHHKTREDVIKLIDTAIEVNSDYAQFNILIPYHGTEIFDEGVKEGLFDKELWRDYAKDPVPSFLEPVWEQNLSREELSDLLKLCYKRFYFRPIPIVKKLFTIQNWGEFKLHVKGALTLLGFGGYRRPGSA